MKEKTIEIFCDYTALVDVKKLKETQGNLKGLSPDNADKLETSIIENGIVKPIYCWWNTKTGKATQFMLDGHQRKIVYVGILDKGYNFDGGEKVPVTYIKASTRKRASEILLQLVAQYGETNPNGLEEYLEANDISLEDAAKKLTIPGIEITGLHKKFEIKSLGGIKRTSDRLNRVFGFFKLTVFTEDQFNEICELLDLPDDNNKQNITYDQVKESIQELLELKRG